jgi:hypothetical protein
MTDLGTALASTSANITAAQAPILTYIITIGGVCLIVGVLIVAVLMGIKWIKASIGGGKGKKK